MDRLQLEKSRARLQAKSIRAEINSPEASIDLIAHFPAQDFRGKTIAGYWPHRNELDMRPLLDALYAQGFSLALPVVRRKAQPLEFHRWTPETEMKTGAFGIARPKTENPITPDIILLPLLAYTEIGERLGYGGGFYDRTLADLKLRKEIWACGVAYAAQKAQILPTEPTDMRLDAILTEEGYRTFP